MLINHKPNLTQLQLNHGKLNPNSQQYYLNLALLRHNSEISALLAGWNQNSNIIILFRNVEFNHLQVLTLSGNKLQSIEGIHKIWMPCLKKLQMIDNQIQNVKSIRKSYWPCFQQIHLGSTNIFPIEMEGFEELYAGKLRQIYGGLTERTITKLLRSNFRLETLIIESEVPRFFSHKFPMIQDQ